ncbi:MAG: N-acetylmuramoyl-L-alanine amidase [Planctomycetota bacterium]|nr:MAG: N-acetylmuramoyl-L-alanine amidase [Planctomycetota bacterium]
MLMRGSALTLLFCLLLLSGCARPDVIRPGERLERTGDEIMVCGQLFHTGTPVVLWTDPGGYDAYRVERRFGPAEQAGWEHLRHTLESPNRYDSRAKYDPALAERVREAGWSVDLLQQVVDQFVIHYDACGTSRTCFRILHDVRGLSVHFLLDVDGTIYQTLDLKERAWHATKANARSIGIEIANIGAYPPDKSDTLDRWYTRDAAGTRMIIPGGGGVRTPGFVARPAREYPIEGEIQHTRLRMYDLTDEQYDALICLVAALVEIFPNLRCDYPRDASGRLVTTALGDEQFEAFSGLIGHYHVQRNKVDPGPAFDWDRLVEGVQQKRARSR